jgi:AAHS family 4-hydroxybenzoate transporter-like MFS transporter
MTLNTEFPSGDEIDIATLIDDRSLGRYQLVVLAIVGLAIIMDGLENRLLPLAIPPLLKEWETTREAFALTTSVGLAGMVLGTTLGGMMGDRIGRRWTIIGSVLAFGIVTACHALANDVTTMTVMRFLAGLGLGGLMPSAASMFAEISPARSRTLAVTVGMVCVPVGGVLSGLLGAAVLPTMGWRALFAIGGLVALVIGFLLFLILPESPRYLARSSREDDQRKLRAVLHHMGIRPGVGRIVDIGETSAVPTAAFRELFANRFKLDTLGLWGAFFFALMVLYMESQWMPTILTDRGYDIEIASIASSCLAFGGMFASIFGIYALSRLGSRTALMGMAAGAVILALGLTQFPMNPSTSPLPLLILLTLVGFLVGGTQIMIYPVATHVYPTSLRSTGIGWAVGIGRIGSVISPFIATAALAAGGHRLFFISMAAGMVCVFLSLWAIRRHVPARGERSEN